MSDLITELKERRVLPAVGVYVASCWVVVEILDRLVERYLLSPYLTDIVFWGLYSLIPAVILVAWSYGRPGKDKATTAQKVGVPINIIATAGLLITVFGGKELGTTANVVTMANEDGVEETHIVPKDNFRRRVAIFFYANQSGDESLDWLQYGATELLTQDLQQDPFMVAHSPWVNWGGGYYGRMKAAGFEDGLGVPRTLLRDIASDANRDHFTEGSIRRDGEDYVITTRVWETASMAQVAEIEERGWDVYTVQDRTSKAVREALGVPSLDVPGYEDLPLADTYGESEEAFKLYLEGLNARLFSGDVAASNDYFDQALAEDPNFVLAHFIKALNLAESGDMPAAAVHLQAAQKMDYRLPSGDRATLKALTYRATGQNDKLLDFVRLQAELRDDAQTHSQLGNILMVAGDTEGAKQSFQTALERDANNVGLNLTLSDLERSSGDMDSAIQYAKIYQEARPEDMEASLKLGDLLRDSGELDQAQEHYEQAQLIESDTVSPLLRQRIIASRRGDESRARELLEEAATVAETANQLAQVHTSASYLEGRMGRINEAMKQLEALRPHLALTQPPFVLAIGVDVPLVGMHLSMGRIAEAELLVQQTLAGLQPPLNQFVAGAEATIAARKGDFAAADEALARYWGVLEELNFDGLRFQAEVTQSEVMAQKGDFAGAAASLKAGIESADSSFIAAQLHAHGIPGLYATLAEYQVRSGDLDGAEASIEAGFKLDPNLPQLWAAKSLMQKESGQPQLAVASVNYALALWESADPEFVEYRDAQALADSLDSSGSQAASH